MGSYILAMRKLYWVCIFLITGMFACDPPTREVQRGEVVNIFSNTLTSADRQLFAAFERSSGIKVNIFNETASQLIDRLIQQQQDSMLADLILLEGIAYLEQAKQTGLLDTLSRGSIVNAIPAPLRDNNLQWLGLGYSVNAIGYLRDSVDTLQVRQYADLADPAWKNKVGWGTKKEAVYQSQLASMLADQGEEFTAEWINRLSGNLVDTLKRSAKLFTISDSSAWLGIVNTAEYAQNIRSKNAKATPPALVFPTPEAYLHLSGVGIASGAPHPTRAHLLLNYLFSRDVMQQYTSRHYLYPARSDVEIPASLRNLGALRPDTTLQSNIASFTDEAERLLNSSGWR